MITLQMAFNSLFLLISIVLVINWLLGYVTDHRCWWMGLEPESMDRMAQGIKLIEARLNKPKWRRIKVGHTIKFLREPERRQVLTVKVLAVFQYKDFKGLITDFDPQIYFGREVDTLLTRLHERYSDQDIARYGIIAFKVRPITK